MQVGRQDGDNRRKASHRSLEGREQTGKPDKQASSQPHFAGHWLAGPAVWSQASGDSITLL
jgi:hypothetical protein